MSPEGQRRCLTCAFNCPGVCDVQRARVLRAAPRAESCRVPSDEALVRRHLETAAGGSSSSSLDVLFERHYRYVVAAICRITGRFDIARDLAQEVFIKALLHIDRFRLDASFTTWLFAIARNCCYDRAKGSALRRETAFDTTQLRPPAVENAALRTLEQQEARRMLLRLMKDARLDVTETRVFGLHYAAGVPLDTLTVRLRLENRSGAKARIVSARRKLSRALARWERITGASDGRPPQGRITPLRIA